MSRQSRVQSIVSSPVMVGALTVLMVIVAVFLAYNANNGLPFVPTYRISVEVPQTNSLVRGNDVRVAGVRVGIVESIQPIQNNDGQCGAPAEELSYCAKLNLKLDKTVDPLPEDSTVVIRSRSALGLKYLQIDPGTSDTGLPEGSALTVSAAKPEPVDLDQVFNMFSEKTRSDIQKNTAAFGGAIAGRGPSLNEAFGVLLPLLQHLTPVMRNLSSSDTNLAALFPALLRVASEVAPVAEQQANVLVVLDTTFAAFANVARPYIQDSIVKGVVAQDTLAATAPNIRSFLSNSAGLFNDFLPAATVFAKSSPATSEMLVFGTPIVRRSPIFNAQLPPTAKALEAFGNDPNVTSGLTAVQGTLKTLTPTLKLVSPAQTVCQYASKLFANAQEMSSEGHSTGKWLRAITVMPPTGPNAESGPSSAPANGPARDNFLHYIPYPETAGPGQSGCSAGYGSYTKEQQVIGGAPVKRLASGGAG